MKYTRAHQIKHSVNNAIKIRKYDFVKALTSTNSVLRVVPSEFWQELPLHVQFSGHPCPCELHPHS